MKVVVMRLFVLAVVLLFGVSARAQAPNPFVFSLGPGPGGAVSADFNGDGRADIVLGNGTVLLGNADGTFTASTTVSIGTTLQGCGKAPCPIPFGVVAAGDFTGDGKPDLLIGAQQTLLYVLPGNGDGTFGTPKVTNVGVSLGDVQVFAVNGKLSVVGFQFGQSNGQIFVCLGNGDGTFQTAVPYTVFPSTGIQELAVGDFNGDGKIDILAVGDTPNASGPVGVLLGNGDGTFATSTITSVGVNSPAGVGVADFNGDGKLDLILTGEQTSDFTQQTYFLAGKGDGTFQAPSIVAPGNGTVSVTDLNGDGKPDVVVWATPFIEVLLGNGNGTFQQKATYPSSTIQRAFEVAIGDFNGDGKLDISDGFSAIFGNGDGTFQNLTANIVNVPEASLPTLNLVTTGDFNGDGKTDLAVASNARPNASIFILLGDGTGKYVVANAYSISSAPFNLLTTDFNADKKVDLCFSTQNSDGSASVQVMLGNGDGSFAAPVSSTLGSIGSGPVPIVRVADFNGDGLPDVATITNGQLTVVIGLGDGSFEPPVSYFAGTGATTFGLGDFNADGKPDAVVCSQAGYAVLLGKGDGTLNAAIFPEQGPPPPNPGPVATCLVTAVADFNNDGASDVLLDGVLPGSSSLLLSNGHGTFAPAIPGVSDFVKTVADMNGDGKLDLVANDGVTVYLGNGDGTFASQSISFQPAWINPLIWISTNDQPQVPTNDAVFAVDDFAGTGRPGIAMIVQNLPGGEISMPSPLPVPAPDFLFSVTLPGVVAPNGQTTVIVKSKPIGGFNTDVALSCGGLPASVTCSLTPATLTAGSGQATLTIAASSSAASGSYPLIVSGTAAGVTHDQQRAVTVATSAGATDADLRPVAIDFSRQTVGGMAVEQVATLENAGGATLQISGVSISGTNSADFSISSNSCGTSVAAYASCPIVVAFSPKATGMRSATLAINDNATGGLQVVNLTGVGQDFAVGAASGATSATVAAGKTATYSLSVGANGGFTGTVSLTCGGAPTAATCAVSPTSVMLNGSAAATATVTVTTTAPSEMMPTTAERNDRWTPWIYASPRVVATYAADFAVLIGLLVIFGTRSRRRRMAWVPFAAGVLLLTGAAMSGCGGGGGSSTSTPPPNGGSATGTPAGSYTIVVTATTGSGANAVSHTTNLTLVVQ